MICKVQYFKPEMMAYGGQSYTYRSSLDLKVGDIVNAPTYKGDQKAIVTEIFVPESEINPAWADRIRTVERFWPKEEI